LMTYRNLMLTMLLGGLWHGASWNFVIWGGYHGALLSMERLLRGKRPETAPAWWLYPFKAVLTFALVLISWVFFRAATLADSFQVIGQMFAGSRGKMLLNTWQLGLVAVSLLLAVGEEKWEWFDRLSVGPAWAYAAGLTSMLLCLELFGVTDVTIPFVYFQF